jgi:hypothetical protein
MITKFTRIFFIFILTANFSNAQTTLTSVNIPDVGSLWSNKTINDTTLQPGPGGQGQNWNFFNYLVYPTVISESYVALTGTANDQLFPGANLKLTTFFGYDDYYIRSSSGLQYLGSKSNALELIISNVQNLLTVPMQYGDVISNPAVTGTGIFGNSLTGTITVTADGEGDLVLYTGSFTNTLRVVTDINIVMGQGSGQDTYVQMKKYAWYTSSFKAPVFQISTLEISGFLANAHDKKIAVSTLTTDIQNPEKVNLDFVIQPNPVKNKASIYFNLNHSSNIKLKVLDLTGRLWKEETCMMNTGSCNYQMDLSTLPKGIYILSADYGKATRQRRLIIE